MSLIKQYSNILVQDCRNKDLLKELLGITNGRTVDFDHWLAKRLRKTLCEFCFTQSLCTIEHEKRNCASCILCLGVKLQACLERILSNKTLEHIGFGCH